MPHVAAVDTNVWVSAFLTPGGHPAKLKFFWQANRFDVVVSAPLLAELVEVLVRPRLQAKYRYTAKDVINYARIIADFADFVSVTGRLNLCRDPDDDLLLETALVGQATHVISRDEDVTRDTDLAQRLKDYGIQVRTIQRFLDELRVS